MRIIVTPEQLRSLSSQIQQSGQAINDFSGRLGRILSSLDWESHQALNVDSQVSQARNLSQTLSSQASEMAGFLAERATAFEEADQQGAGGIQGATDAYIKASPEWSIDAADVTRTVSEQVGRISSLGELLQPMAAATVIGASMYAGSKYAGEVIINLPEWLRTFHGLREIRTLAGLPGQLNHFAYANLPSKMLQWGVFFSIPVIAGKWISDAGQYQGTRMVSAMAVDAALTLAPVVASFAAAQVITWGCAALGTVLFPGVGTAAGYAVGTAAATLVGGTVANVASQWAIDRYHVRDSAIDQFDNTIKSVVNSVVSARQGNSIPLNVASS